MAKQVRAAKAKGSISAGKPATDKANFIPPPRMGKGPKPQTIKNSYAPHMLKPTRKG